MAHVYTDGVKNTVVYRRCAAWHRHIFTMVTIGYSPATVTTVMYRRLVAYTLHFIQQDKPGARTVASSNYRSSVPEINK